MGDGTMDELIVARAEILKAIAQPTQVFSDAKGKEVKRHMGFMDRDEIIAEFKALGVK